MVEFSHKDQQPHGQAMGYQLWEFFKLIMFYLIEAEWCIYVSKLTTIASDNGLSPG